MHPRLRAWKQTATAKTFFLYDGTDPVCELDGSTGAVTAVNTFGAQGLLSRHVTAGNTSTFYTFDERGNVAQRTDGTGAVLSTDLYDAYGKLLAGGAAGDPWGFEAQSGYYTDAETSLVLCTHRYYDPQAGRFLTRDPISYAGGIDLYEYVGNNPVNEIDPEGTQGVLTAAQEAYLLALAAVAAAAEWAHNHPLPAIYWPWSHPTTVFPGATPKVEPLSQVGPNVQSPRQVGLPVGQKCPHPYIPGRNWKPGMELPGRPGRDGQPEYEDKDGNYWKKGPNHHFPDDPKEWDVTDPKTGKHINVGLAGGNNAGVVR